jgi:hypothetical protein
MKCSNLTFRCQWQIPDLLLIPPGFSPSFKLASKIDNGGKL